MNIFKKQFNLSFMDKVKNRITQQILQTMPIYRKKLILRIGKNIFFPIVLFFVFYLLNASHTNIFLETIYRTYFLFGSIWLFFSSFVHIVESYELYSYQKKFKENQDVIIDFFSSIDDFDFSILYLTKEEIKELFNLKLNEEQLDFLQKIILKHNQISYHDLKKLPSILNKEDIFTQEKEKRKSHQDKLNQFFSQHDLEDNMNGQNIINKLNLPIESEQEIKLSSRL